MQSDYRHIIPKYDPAFDSHAHLNGKAFIPLNQENVDRLISLVELTGQTTSSIEDEGTGMLGSTYDIAKNLLSSPYALYAYERFKHHEATNELCAMFDFSAISLRQDGLLPTVTDNCIFDSAGNPHEPIEEADTYLATIDFTKRFAEGLIREASKESSITGRVDSHTHTLRSFSYTALTNEMLLVAHSKEFDHDNKTSMFSRSDYLKLSPEDARSFIGTMLDSTGADQIQRIAHEGASENATKLQAKEIRDIK